MTRKSKRVKKLLSALGIRPISKEEATELLAWADRQIAARKEGSGGRN